MKYLILPLLLLFVACGGNQNTENQNSNQATIQQESSLFKIVPATQSKVNFINQITENEIVNVIEYEYLYNGGGIAAGDINNDGLIDLFFTANMQPNALYLNKGNFVFEDITRAAGVAGKKGWTTGCTMADVNNDGWLDIYVCRSGNLPDNARENLLFINQKDNTFIEEGAKYGLNDAAYSTHASFFDFDRDGDLDMYLLNHNISSPKGFFVADKKKERSAVYGDKLFENQDGKFVEISEKAGIISNPIGFGLGVSTADVNKDGWPDIFVTNDYYEQDYLYLNQKNGTFKESLENKLNHTSHFSMGVDIADFNNDRLPDIMTLDMMPEDNKRQKLLQGPANYDKYQMQVQAGFYHQNMRNMLQLNKGNGEFAELGQLSGVDKSDWSWSVLFADFDNDGYKDLSITNGYLRDYTNMDFLKFTYPDMSQQAQKQGKPSADIVEVIKQMPQTKLCNYLFKNQGDLSFENVSKKWGFEDSLASNGMAYADLDNDGDLDLVLNNLNSVASIYENTSSGNYLQVKLENSKGNHFGIGAKVICYANGLEQEYEILQSRGYQSSVPPIAHFGLASNTSVDSLFVIWPNSTITKRKNIKANQLFSVDDSNAEKFEPLRKESSKILALTDNVLNYSHQESNFIDYKNVPLVPHLLSREGPGMAVADFNKDGLDDVLIGGAAGQASSLFMQNRNGNFSLQKNMPWEKYANSENLVIHAFDANKDGFLDLYFGSGSFEFPENDPALQDRLYINKGSGNFEESSIPVNLSSTSAVVSLDIDQDGDLDLFVGTRLVQQKFPMTPESFLLLNNGKGEFEKASQSITADLKNLGLVTCASTADINSDGIDELIIGCEYNNIKIFESKTGSLQELSFTGLAEVSGWWNTLEIIDIDQDGDLDIIAGNKGENDFIQASVSEPARYYGGDMDQDGKYDIICSNYNNGEEFPCASLDELHKQFNLFRKKYNRYETYSNASMSSLLKDLNPTVTWEANNFSSGVFINEGSKFTFKPFPKLAQSAPINAVITYDFNKDGNIDILAAGNNLNNRTEFGRMDANNGWILLGNGKGEFKVAKFEETGLDLKGQVNGINGLIRNGKNYIIISRNNDSSLMYQIL